jgi:hypothetical protein
VQTIQPFGFNRRKLEDQRRTAANRCPLLGRNKMPARKIARSLKRSEGATQQKTISLGLSLDSRG